jgi:hypothetical protein
MILKRVRRDFFPESNNSTLGWHRERAVVKKVSSVIKVNAPLISSQREEAYKLIADSS